MKRAFTLIELLVVIFIIALLLSILTPTLRLAKDYARRIVCMSNQKQLALATHAYVFENDEFLPLAATQYETPRTASMGKVGPPTWDQRILSYSESDDSIFACQTVSMLNDKDNDLIPRTYTINALITGLDDMNSLFGYTKSLRMTDISQPSSTLLFGEHFWPSWTGYVQGAVFHQWSLVRPIHNVKYSTETFDSPWDPEGAQKAHGITNFSFVDGHSDSIQTAYTQREGNPVQGLKFEP